MVITSAVDRTLTPSPTLQIIALSPATDAIIHIKRTDSLSQSMVKQS